MSEVRQRGKKLSPWTIINIMARVKSGEKVADLAQEFSINRATINRWLLKWGKEATLVEQVRVGKLALRATAQIGRAKKQATG